ncbi:MAG: M28 family peptidase [Lentisphaeria bacterium]|jgi:aminopeptidase YwaD|nr:M28 family peptidase [Lentisphaeria bacterium]
MNTSLIRERLQSHLTMFCLRLGSRHVGSPGEAAAADYIAEQFTALGVAARRESYPVTGWAMQSFELVNLTRGRAVPAATACFFSPSAEKEDTLLWLRPADLQQLDAQPVQNRLCFVESWSEGADIAGRNKIAEDLDRLGAAGAIFISDSLTHGAMAPSTKIQRSPNLHRLGAAAVAQDGALDLARHKADRYRLAVKARTFQHQSCNVIATLPGLEGRGKGVVGAHYDTAPLVQGALDNASGTAVILELARILQCQPPNGPALDIVAFSGEEYTVDGLQLGSGNYCQNHLGDDLRWFMNIDHVGGLIATPELRIGLPEKLPRLTPATIPFTDVHLGGDTKPFHLAGIPTLWYGEKDPFLLFHTCLDAMDAVDFDRMTDVVIDAVHILGQLTR